MSTFVFAGMKNHESIAMGGRIVCSSARSLELEWLLYPQALEGCPNPYHWDYGAPPLTDSSFRAHGFEVTLRADPPGATLRQPASGLELHLDDITLSREDGRATASIQSGVNVRYYGLGEQFASLEHSGRRIVCESSDWWNKSWFDPPGWKHSYAPIPFLLTTAGYGLLVHGSSRVSFDLRHAASGGGPSRYGIAAESPSLRITVIPGRSLKEILREFVELTGKPYVPPRWALEPLLACACNHRERCWTESRLDEYIEMFRKHRLPNGMVMDEAWIWTRRDSTSPTGHHMHYEQYGAFEPDNYDHPAEAIQRLEREGRSRTIFIIGPFIGCKSKHLDKLKTRGWLVRRASNPEHLLMGQYNHHFLDFTHPDAVAWWKERLGEVLDLGVSGFFADFGEGDEQMDALYHRGGTGRSMGQEYNLIYKQAVRDVLREKRGDDYYFIGRAGWTGVQAVAGIMQGDPACTFEGMRQSLISLQSNALTGQGVVSHNLGGYAGEQSALVYLRWIAFGAFCPLQHIWTSGESGGEPWNFRDQQVIEVYRSFMQWRIRLLPYLSSALEAYRRDHLPLVRPMALEFPEDPVAADAVDQFLCGPELLVAPILNPEGRRSVYLPRGRWVDFWTLAVQEGPGRIDVECPVDRIPVFAAEGALLPLEGNPYPGRDLRQEPLEIHVLGEPTGRTLVLADQGRDIRLGARRQGGEVHLSSEAIDRRHVRWVWRGCERPLHVAIDGKRVAESDGDSGPGYSHDEAARTLTVRLQEPTGETQVCIQTAHRAP